MSGVKTLNHPNSDLTPMVALIPLDDQGLEMLSVNKSGEVFRIRPVEGGCNDIAPRTDPILGEEEAIASSMVSVVGVVVVN